MTNKNVLITDDFVDSYRSQTPPWGFNGLGEIVYLRTYSRPVDGKNRNETWPETLQRVINGAIEIGVPYTQAEAEALFDHMFNLRCSFSGRALWQLGTPLVRKFNGASLNNCLAYETKIVTRDGIRSLGEVAGTDVEVLTEKGWVKAPVRSFGVQDVQEVVFRPANRGARSSNWRKARSNVRHSVVATPNHRWILTNGEVTDNLKIGDIVKANVNENNEFDIDAFIHGFVFGDGTVAYVKADGTFTHRVRLCGRKGVKWLELFVSNGWRRIQDASNGDPILVKDHSEPLKSLPVDPSPEYAAGFLEGWIEADGHRAHNNVIGLASQHPDAGQWLTTYSASAGYLLVGGCVGATEVTNFGKRKSSLMRFSLTREERGWAVESIVPKGSSEVFCATVPEHEAFTLASGIYTGNCFFVNIESIADFEFLFEHLMLGGGVGFSVERSKIHEFPKVKSNVVISHERTNDADVIVPDSREGWKRLVHSVLKSYFYTGKSFTYSTILVREFGAPLNTFGGTASGPGALIDGVADICKVMENRAGKKLRSIDVLDICNIIGRIVVSGSSRRSAQIAIGDPDDILFLRAKNWGAGNVPGWRANSNNSIYADGYDEILPELWKGYDGSGEPYGLLNRKLARTVGRLGEKRPDPSVEGFNPCVTGDSWILTDNGPRRVIDLLNSPFTAIVDGKPYQATAFWQTGIKTVLNIATSEGYSVRATEDHKILTPSGWVEAGMLEPGDEVVLNDHLGASWDGNGSEDDGYVLGNLIGDGTFYPDGTPCVALWTSDAGHEGPKDRLTRIMESMPHRSDWSGWRKVSNSDQIRMKHVALRDLASSYRVFRGNKTITDEIEQASSAFSIGFLRGLFDADGHIEGYSTQGGVSVRLSQSNLSLLESAQRMLARLGVKSAIRTMRESGEREMPGGTYFVKDSYRLIITGQHAERFMAVVGFENTAKNAKWLERVGEMSRGFYRKPMTAVVAEITIEGEDVVYDCTVDDVHAFDANGLYLHNCAEISLGDGESCNLATIFLPNIESQSQFAEISRLLYLCQKQITGLNYPYEKTTKITKKNRRLGQSVTGILQATEKQLGWLSPGYEILRDFDENYSAANNIPRSVRLTTVQPSGTLALLPGVTPGVHPAYARYYIRRVRFGAADPLVEDCRKRGYKVVPDIGIDGREDRTRWVVEFPAKSPENAVLAKDMTAVEQLEWVKRMQTEWADNAVSVTVYYRPEELPEIKNWLSTNYDNSVKSVSFLLHSDHNFPLAPYEEITEEQYHALSSKINMAVPIGSSPVQDDMLDDPSCATGACPVR